MMDNTMIISAVIPAYNAEEHIARAIQSVLAQTRPVDEIIVVDDGSTDNTAEVVRSFGDEVKLIRQANAGVSAARNTGIKAATGNWIAFLDSDDEWLPEKIQRQVNILRKNPDLAWVIGNYYECLCDEERRAEQTPRHTIENLLGGKNYFESYFKAWQHSLWGCSDVQVIQRDVLLQCGLFPEGQRIAEDMDTWLRVAYLHPKVGFVAAPLAVYHLGIAQSGQQRHNRETFHVNFIEKHCQLAQQNDMLSQFLPAASFIMRLWIRGMLFEGRKEEIRELLKKFPQCFSFGYRAMINTLTIFPSFTVLILHCLSKIVRTFRLRRRLTRPPAKVT